MLCFFPVVFSLAYYSTRQGCWNQWDMGAIAPPSLLPNQIFVGIENLVTLSTILFKRHWIIPAPLPLRFTNLPTALLEEAVRVTVEAMLGGIQQLRGPIFIQFWPQPPSNCTKMDILPTICPLSCDQAWTFHLPLPPSSCPCSYLMTLWLFMRGLWGTRPLSTMRSKPIPSRNSICRHILF